MARNESRDDSQGHRRLDPVMEGVDEIGMGMDPFAQVPDETGEPLLDEDRQEKDPGKKGPVVDRGGMKGLVEGPLGDLDPRNEEEDGHDERGHVLHPSVAEGGFRRGRPGGHPEAENEYGRIGQMRKEMEGVGEDGNGTGEEGEDDLENNRRA